jgi:insertion element IS1 protein InsB
LGDHSAKAFEPLWRHISTWQCYFYVTDGWSVGLLYSTRLRHLARLHRKTLWQNQFLNDSSLYSATPRVNLNSSLYYATPGVFDPHGKTNWGNAAETRKAAIILG